MPVSFPNPILQQNTPVIPGVNLNPILQTFLQTHQLQLQRESLSARKEELAFQREQLASQRELRALELQLEMEKAKQGMVGEQIEALEATNPENVERGGPMGQILTRDPRTGEEGSVWAGHPGFAQGEHPSVSMGSEFLGVPEVSIKPRGLEQVIQDKVREEYLTERAGAVGKQEGEMITVDPTIATAYPQLEVGEKVSPDFLSKLPGIENMLELPPEMGGGQLPKSEADLAAKVYEQRMQNYRANLTDKRLRERGSRYLDADVFTDEEVTALANQVATGQAPLEQIEGRGGTRVRVMLNLASRGVAIPRKGLIDKMDNFSSVQSLSDKLRASYSVYMDAVDAGDPYEVARAMDQFKREMMGFASFTARDFGEKGVLTDRDREVFAKLLGYSTSTLMVEGMARKFADVPVEDMWSTKRLDQLQETIDQIYNRSFGEYEQRVKAKLMLGPTAKNTPLGSTPTIETSIPTIQSKEGMMQLKQGVKFTTPDGRMWERKGDGAVEIRRY